MKTKILDINGKAKADITLPKWFSNKVREDLIFKVLEAKKSIQPYGPSPVAGNQASASGKIVHRRHVWKSQYGRGMSRIPRKSFSRRGTQFNWEGATVPQARGGRKAHSPKIASNINTKRINKKELIAAFKSAISATANEKEISKRYSTLKDKKIQNIPFIVESKIISLKAKELTESLKKILGKDLFEISVKKKTVRSGRGKLRGRKYKSNTGLLIVKGKNETLKSKNFEVVSSNEVGVSDLARGGPGRLTIYTESAIKELEERVKQK